MKHKRRIILLALAGLIAVLSVATIPKIRRQSEIKRTARALQSLPRDRVVAAIEVFVRDRKAVGDPLPPSVTLDELVARGYLRLEKVSVLTGRDVRVSLAADAEPLVRVRMWDGLEVVELSDGSIQMAVGANSPR